MADDETTKQETQDEQGQGARSSPVTLQRVDDEGNITGLGTHAGREVLLVPVPEGFDRERVESTLETPRQLALEVLDAARQHKELGQEQVESFRKRYGKGPGEDLSRRFQDINADLRDRFRNLQQDLNRRVEELEERVETQVRELESQVGPRVQAAFRRGGRDDEGPRDATQARTVDLQETEDDAEDAPGSSGKGTGS